MVDENESPLDRRFVVEAGLAARIADAVSPALEDLGFRLVRVKITGSDSQTLQIMAERADGTMSIDDCETVSRQLSPLLDTYDFIPGTYRLEVSSPGIDRPLVRPSDFEAWAGYEVKIELKQATDGRKRFRGRLEGFEAQEVRIEVDLPEHGRQILGLPIDLVGDAKLVLTDELVRESLKRAKTAGDGRVTDGAEQPDGLTFGTGETDGTTH